MSALVRLRKEEREALEAVRALGEAMQASRAFIDAQPTRTGAALLPELAPLWRDVEGKRTAVMHAALRLVKSDARKTEKSSKRPTVAEVASEGPLGMNAIPERRRGR